MSKEYEPYALLHENLHYIQSVTTYTGVYRFICFWSLYTQIAQLRKSADDRDFTEEEKSQIEERYREANEKIQVFEPEIGKRSVIIETETSVKNGVQRLALPNGEKLFAYIKPVGSEMGAYFFDTKVIRESMAQAYEMWLGHDISGWYQNLVDDQDPYYFQYVMGIETVKSVTGWKNEKNIGGATILLADFALGHVVPGNAFVRGAMLLAENYAVEPEVLDLEDINDFLHKALMVEEMWEEVSKAERFLELLLERANQSEDQFDKAVSSMIGVMLRALHWRKEAPSYFVQNLLYNFSDEGFLSDFHMPAYISGNEFVDTGIHPDRHEFVLYMHALHHRLLNIVDEDADSECPYLHSKTCGFEKTEACKKAPWNRRFESEKKNETPEVCVYRFVEHALQHPA